MHLAQRTRKASNGESLIGLIDGAQAIVMTLLVIEMPVLIIRLLEKRQSFQELYLELAMIFLGYLLASVIVYDIWSIQKSLFASTHSSGSQNLACISTLWLSTLIPPILFIAEHFAQTPLQESMAYGISSSHGVLVFRSIAISIVLAIHLILFAFSRQSDNAIDLTYVIYNSRLLRLRVMALVVIVPFSVCLGLIGELGYVLIPAILFVPFIFVPVKLARQS